MSFNQAIWNQGMVEKDGRLILLVTLEKGAMWQLHRYDDQFMSDREFRWQSQNRTKRESKHGRMIRDNRAAGTMVHLFVRRRKVMNGKAAPFIYCGPVDFVRWEGEAPITVDWELRNPVPKSLWETLKVPTRAE